MSKKQSEEYYHVYDGNDHEYTIVVTKTNERKTYYNLYYSNTSTWTNTIAGTRILTIEDDGNSYHLPDIVGAVEPDKFAELAILTSFIKKYDKYLAPDYTIKKPEQVIVTI